MELNGSADVIISFCEGGVGRLDATGGAVTGPQKWVVNDLVKEGQDRAPALVVSCAAVKGWMTFRDFSEHTVWMVPTKGRESGRFRLSDGVPLRRTRACVGLNTPEGEVVVLGCTEGSGVKQQVEFLFVKADDLIKGLVAVRRQFEEALDQGRRKANTGEERLRNLLECRKTMMGHSDDQVRTYLKPLAVEWKGRTQQRHTSVAFSRIPFFVALSPYSTEETVPSADSGDDALNAADGGQGAVSSRISESKFTLAAGEAVKSAKLTSSGPTTCTSQLMFCTTSQSASSAGVHGAARSGAAGCNGEFALLAAHIYDTFDSKICWLVCVTKQKRGRPVVVVRDLTLPETLTTGKGRVRWRDARETLQECYAQSDSGEVFRIRLPQPPRAASSFWAGAKASLDVAHVATISDRFLVTQSLGGGGWLLFVDRAAGGDRRPVLWDCEEQKLVILAKARWLPAKAAVVVDKGEWLWLAGGSVNYDGIEWSDLLAISSIRRGSAEYSIPDGGDHDSQIPDSIGEDDGNFADSAIIHDQSAGRWVAVVGYGPVPSRLRAPGYRELRSIASLDEDDRSFFQGDRVWACENQHHPWLSTPVTEKLSAELSDRCWWMAMVKSRVGAPEVSKCLALQKWPGQTARGSFFVGGDTGCEFGRLVCVCGESTIRMVVKAGWWKWRMERVGCSEIAVTFGLAKAGARVEEANADDGNELKDAEFFPRTLPDARSVELRMLALEALIPCEDLMRQVADFMPWRGCNTLPAARHLSVMADDDDSAVSSHPSAEAWQGACCLSQGRTASDYYTLVEAGPLGRSGMVSVMRDSHMFSLMQTRDAEMFKWVGSPDGR